MQIGDLHRRYLDLIDPTALDEEDNAPAPARFTMHGGDTAAKQAALAEVTPETYGTAQRFGLGVLHDVQGIGKSLGALSTIPVREAFRLVTGPKERFRQYSEALTPIAHDPVGSAVRGAKALGSAFIEPYTPREGESGFDVIKRNVLDRPLGAAMDVAAVVGGPAGIAEKLGVPGAGALARGVAAADPINIARKISTGGIAETFVPGAVQRLKASKLLTEHSAEQTTRLNAANNAYAERVKDVFSTLDDTEKTLFFPYAEGRLKAMTEGGMAGQVAELTPTGQWQPRAIDPSRLARLESARQGYLPLVDELERTLGYHPDQAAIEGGLREQRSILKEGGDPLHPDSVARTQDAAEKWRQKAADAQLARRTVSTRTALDVRKTQDFQTELAKIRLEDGAEKAAEYARQYPVEPTTPDEALAVMGPQGGIYVPHSGEVLTRDQSTIGNTLVKVRESVPWKQNTGSLFRTGQLDGLQADQALMRTFMAARRHTGIAEVYDAVGRHLGEALPAAHPFGSDPDLRAGTHQLLKPGIVHQEGALGEIVQDLQQHLMEHSGEPGVDDINLMDLVTAASGRIDQTLPLKRGATVYKIPTAVGDSLKAFQRSFEPPTNAIVKALDATADPFHFITLNLRPARILNNALGNTLFQVMQGISPFTTRGLGAISDMARAVASKSGFTSSAEAAKLARIYDVAGVATGGLERDILGSGTRSERFLESGKLGAPGRGLASYGAEMAKLNQHVENTARALSAFFELRGDAPSRWGRAITSANDVISIGDRVEQLAKAGEHALDDAGWHKALGRVNEFLNDYNKTSTSERTMWRRIFPYEKFYRHSVNLALSYPFKHPGKSLLLRSLGNAALSDARDTLSSYGFDWHSMVPETMRDSIPVDVRDDPERGRQVLMLNTRGPNPFSLLNATDPGMEGLGALHPLVKAAVEFATGVDLYRMQRFEGANTTFAGKEVDPATGEMIDSRVRPGPISLFARQFFPVQIARELIAGGRIPLDSASIADMVMAGAGGMEGYAFKVDERGQPIRHPTTSPFARLLGPAPQILEAPTKKQAQGQSGSVSEAFNKLGRGFPDLQENLRASYRKKRAERAQGEPRVKYRRED